MKHPEFVEITNSHRRAISTRLALLDEALCRFEQWANGSEMHPVFYSEESHFSKQQRKEMLSEIDEIRKILRELFSMLPLKKKTQNISDVVWGQCLGIQEQIMELESKYLQRYGNLPLGLSAYIDLHIADIIKRIQRISTIAIQRITEEDTGNG